MADRNRRLFLQAAGLTLGLPWLLTACGGRAPANQASNLPVNPPAGGPALPAHRGSLIGFGHEAGGQRFISVINLDVPEPEAQVQNDIDFLGHGFAPNPARPHLAVISQKHGKGCVEWDMKARKVTRVLSTAESREFYGHGAFTPDGRTLFLAESIVADGSYDGVVTVRDGDSYEIRGEFPSHGIAPHDTLLIDDGATLVVTNGGGPLGTDELPCVCFVDVKTRELRHKLTFRSPRINAGHLAMTARGDMAVVSAPRRGIADDAPDATGAISFYSPGGELRTPEDPILGSMKLETLSVAIHEPSMIVAATSPAGNLVTFWDFRTAKLVAALRDFKSPRGISLTRNGKFFALTHDAQTHAVLIDSQTFKPVADTKIETSYISGSHNYIYDMPA